jgi:hypothetical protein
MSGLEIRPKKQYDNGKVRENKVHSFQICSQIINDLGKI